MDNETIKAMDEYIQSLSKLLLKLEDVVVRQSLQVRILEKRIEAVEESIACGMRVTVGELK